MGNTKFKRAGHLTAEASDIKLCQSKQVIVNEDLTATLSHQAELVSLFGSNKNHLAAFTLSDNDGAPSTSSEIPALLHRSDYDKNGDPPCPRLLKIPVVILVSRPLRLILAPPVETRAPAPWVQAPTETHSSKCKTDSKKRKVPQERGSGNPKQLKTNTEKKAPQAPIEIDSESESENDGSSDSNSLLNELKEVNKELEEAESSDGEPESSDGEPESSDNEGQKTDDERHLPRPPKRSKRRTDKELKVTRLNKITHPAEELQEGLGEDDAGNFKDGEVPAHIHVGEIDEIATKGPKPDHHMLEKKSAKSRTDNGQDKPKTEVPIKAFPLMIQYAMRAAVRIGKRTREFHPIWRKDLARGLDSKEYSVIFNMAVKYLSSTNFFNATVLSAWGAQKRINIEADLLREASARDFHVFHHLRSAIELSDTSSWGKGLRGQLLMLGRRGEEDSVPRSTKSQTKRRKKLPEAVTDPYTANAINIQQALTEFMQPYPFRSSLPTGVITKIITAEEWGRQNAHWLDQLMHPDSTKEKFGPTIEEEVTEQTFPLISNARRYLLSRWAKSEDFDLDSRLLEAPILPQVEVEDETIKEIFTVETDATKRSIRAIETAALGLPKAHQKTAALIKQHTHRLFACRDHEIDNNTIMAQSVAKLRQPSYVTAKTLQVGFKDNETRLLSRVDPAQTAREKGLEALEVDMQSALKTLAVDGSADQLILFLKTHWRMRDDEISDWQDMATSACHITKEAGHPINQSDQEACDNHDWDSLLRLANTRGGKALVTLLNMEPYAPDEVFLSTKGVAPNTVNTRAQDHCDKADEQGAVAQQTESIDDIAPDTILAPSQDMPQAP
ncbi:hypothetical protein FPANT_3377 [Fusarium pseudoanthophilum]|uniref:Uncharacterized protein n=1 Tax=Fusarium pseudoanthophilum TaxID=48495 RepID=A0A8H5PNN0_9HYPO|nr:hypothetical protein FPANT_3377 [Fusarium pseudoanthophilum]